jgi:hypothetical protein
MMLMTLFEHCVTWVSRGDVNASVEVMWTTAWVACPW